MKKHIGFIAFSIGFWGTILIYMGIYCIMSGMGMIQQNTTSYNYYSQPEYPQVYSISIENNNENITEIPFLEMKNI